MEKWIGVVGGVGPFAGIDLLNKIAAQTVADKDQDHLTVLNWSQPDQIVDRTEFLLGQVAQNPAIALAAQVKQLAKMGAGVVGIPCNTAHAPRIFNQIRAELAAASCDILLLHMIEEVGRFLHSNLPDVRKIGVLSTTGTYRAGVYADVLQPLGFTAVLPPLTLQTVKINPTIQFTVSKRAVSLPSRCRKICCWASTRSKTPGLKRSFWAAPNCRWPTMI